MAEETSLQHKPDTLAQTFLRLLSFLPLFQRLKEDHGKSPQQEREHKNDTDAKHDSDEFISISFSTRDLTIVDPSP
jgi:hypothetical protein